MKHYTAICQTLCGGPICGVTHGDKYPDDMQPDLFPSKYKAKQDILEVFEEGGDADDWDIEEVTVDGDLMTIVGTGQVFNWREGH